MRPPGGLRRGIWRWILPTAILFGAAPGVAGAATPTLVATAGMGGVCRPGRWMPVRIILQTATEDVDGDLVAEWGGAVVRRAVSVTAPGRKEFELLLRTSEVTDRVTVRLHWPGAVLSADAPLRVATADERVTVCVTGPASQAALDGCTTSMAPEALPRSLRGYDAADAVVWLDAASGLVPDQRRALDQWRAVRALEDTGRFTAVPELPSVLSMMARRSRVSPPLIWGAVTYVALLAGMALLVQVTRIPALAILSVTALLIVAAAASVLAAGRAGPASAIVLHHVSVVQQIAGAGVSLVSTRAVAVFPASDAFALRASVTDGSMRPDGDDPGAQETFDDRGRPLLSGRYGLGAAQPVSLEGVIERHPFDVSRRGDVLRVTNTSDMDLHDCRLAPGSSAERTVALGRGASVEFTWPREAAGPLMTCHSSASPIAFTSEGRHVLTTGETTVSVFQAALAWPAQP